MDKIRIATLAYALGTFTALHNEVEDSMSHMLLERAKCLFDHELGLSEEEGHQALEGSSSVIREVCDYCAFDRQNLGN